MFSIMYRFLSIDTTSQMVFGTLCSVYVVVFVLLFKYSVSPVRCCTEIEWRPPPPSLLMYYMSTLPPPTLIADVLHWESTRQDLHKHFPKTEFENEHHTILH